MLSHYAYKTRSSHHQVISTTSCHPWLHYHRNYLSPSTTTKPTIASNIIASNHDKTNRRLQPRQNQPPSSTTTKPTIAFNHDKTNHRLPPGQNQPSSLATTKPTIAFNHDKTTALTNL